MDFGELNFNENINDEYNSGANSNLSTFKLNLNPFISDNRSRQKINNFSLEYLKEIAKSVTLVNNEESKHEDVNKIFSSKSGSSVATEFLDKLSKRTKKNKIKVTFKDSLIEPEEKKGKIISFVYFYFYLKIFF